MNVCLKPVDELGMDDFYIDGNLLSIGRQEEPFVSCSHSSVAKLSRKHARVFEEDGAAYVVDLGSLNGTKLNAQTVIEKPIKLCDGDKIEFAGLAFQVEIESTSNDKEIETENEIGVVLSPDNENNGQALLVTEFPFLVSKSEGAFYDNKEHFKTVHQYISRRHAYIFIKNDLVYVEDLHSTNGTYKNDIKLEDESVTLEDGDVVAFGDRELRFQVKILKQERTGTLHVAEGDVTESDKATIVSDVQNATEITTSSPKDSSQYGDFDVEPGTILVDRASPFLDIFCPDNNPKTSKPEPAERAEKEQKVQSEHHKSPSVFRRLSVFLTELRSALSGNGAEQGDSSDNQHSVFKKTGIALIVIISIVALASVLFFRESAERDITRLIAEGQYQDAAAMANQYLSNNSSDPFVNRLAHEALLKTVVPEWLSLIEKGDFSEANSLLEQAIKANTYNTSGLQALRLLLLVGDFERFIQGHENETLTYIYLTEDKISALVSRWEADASGYRQTMDRITSVVPDFQVSHATLYSQLRMLSAEQDLYSRPLSVFKKEISSSLDENSPGTPETLSLVIAHFIEKYPSIGGVKALEDDLNRYLLIKAAVIEDDPIALKQLAEHLKFKTPPFKQKVQSLLVNMPTDEFVEQIGQAGDLWAKGELERAITILQTLQGQSETRLVEILIKRYLNVKESWDALGGGDGGPYAREQLIELYKLLDKEKDAYLWTVLQSEFETLEIEIQKQADKHIISARRAWTEYLKNGGIWGALRLESEMSATYLQQAKLLSDAFNDVSLGVGLYDILDAQNPQVITAFEAQVKGESSRQRKWINDLHLVLDKSAREAKTSKLPSEKES